MYSYPPFSSYPPHASYPQRGMPNRGNANFYHSSPSMRSAPLPQSMPQNMMRSPSFLSVPHGQVSRGLFSSLGASAGASAGKLTLSKVLNGTENLIATVNQVIPIYQQVKPLWDNSKILKNAVKKVFPTRQGVRQESRKEVIQDPEIITPQAKESPKQKVEQPEEQKEPNRPFF